MSGYIQLCGLFGTTFSLYFGCEKLLRRVLNRFVRISYGGVKLLCQEFYTPSKRRLVALCCDMVFTSASGSMSPHSHLTTLNPKP